MISREDILLLAFPKLCVTCRDPVHKGEETLCAECRLHAHKTNFHVEEESPLEQAFWGTVDVGVATSFFHLANGNGIRKIVHQLKYRGRKEVGISVGKLYGCELHDAKSFSLAEVIVPVPLHTKKIRKRGYNQSAVFAEGLGKSLNIPVEPKAVIRIRPTESQTRKHQYERFQNVNNVFTVVMPERLSGKHILLVDDVITTGSTLAACAESILKVPGTKISIVTIACA